MKRRLTFLAVVEALGLAGCTTPSVPLPPPDADSVTFGLDAEAGTATFEADALPSWAGAWVIVRDEVSGEGAAVRARADGSVGPTAPFAATDGDTILISYELPDGQASGLCLILHDGRSSAAYQCE